MSYSSDTVKKIEEEFNSCKDCKFFYEKNMSWEDCYSKCSGYCRRFPPEIEKSNNLAVFPKVLKIGWCGEFVKKET